MGPKKIKAALLGATGAVGALYIELLKKDPHIELVYFAASERSKGLRIQDQPVGSIEEYNEIDCDLVFSALDSTLAATYDLLWASPPSGRKRLLISHSPHFRLHPKIPMVIPEINGERVIGMREGIIAKSNCTLQSFCLPLFLLDRLVGLKRAVVTSFQAVSGAGMRSLHPLEILDNVIPYIHGEEEKCGEELDYFLGRSIPLSMHCNRVPVLDGHLTTVSAEFEKNVSIKEVEEVFSRNRSIQLREECDRPQPRLDRDALEGMGITIGRIRPCPALNGIRFVSLSHNRIRGAAGGGIMTAKLAYGFIEPFI